MDSVGRPFPALLLIWVTLAAAGLWLVLSGTVSGLLWVILLWVVVGWSVLELPTEFVLMRQVQRERRQHNASGPG